MNIIRIAAAAVALGAGAAVVMASPDAPQSNVDYRTLADAQPTSSGKRVEVTEFFAYNCPRCNALDPALAQWVRAQGGKIVFRRVPVAFRPEDTPLQKFYYALEALGKADELHAKIFKAIHGERKALRTDDEMADYAVEHGINREKFLSVYNSFSVQSKVRRAAQLMTSYEVESRPLVAIAGRYETSPAMLAAGMRGKPESELISAALKVMGFLVERSAKR